MSSDTNGATSNDDVPSDAYWTNYGLPTTETNYGNLWVISDNTKIDEYWLATSSAYSNTYVLTVNYQGQVSEEPYNRRDSSGLRPIAILDSNVVLTWDNAKNKFTLN